MKQWYAPIYKVLGWFSPTLTAPGWFDRTLSTGDPVPSPPVTIGGGELIGRRQPRYAGSVSYQNYLDAQDRKRRKIERDLAMAEAQDAEDAAVVTMLLMELDLV